MMKIRASLYFQKMFYIIKNKDNKLNRENIFAFPVVIVFFFSLILNNSDNIKNIKILRIRTFF